MLKLAFRMINLKIIPSKLLPHLPGANELSTYPLCVLYDLGEACYMFARGNSWAFGKWHAEFRFLGCSKTLWYHWLSAAWYDRHGQEGTYMSTSHSLQNVCANVEAKSVFAEWQRYHLAMWARTWRWMTCTCTSNLLLLHAMHLTEQNAPQQDL